MPSRGLRHGALSLEDPEFVPLETLGPLVVVGAVVTLVILTAVLGGTPRDIDRLSDHLTSSGSGPSRNTALVVLASASVLLLLSAIALLFW